MSPEEIQHAAYEGARAALADDRAAQARAILSSAVDVAERLVAVGELLPPIPPEVTCKIALLVDVLLQRLPADERDAMQARAAALLRACERSFALATGQVGKGVVS